MFSKNSNSRKKTRAQWVRRWHRRIGKISMILVLILCITGIILNRTDSLRLDDNKIENRVISKLYGLSPTSSPLHFKSAIGWFSWLEGRLYLDESLIAQTMPQILGTADLDEMIITASRHQISLFMADGQLVEHLKGDFLPAPVDMIGIYGGQKLIIQTANGLFSTDIQLSSWQDFKGKAEDIIWSRPVSAPPALTQSILDNPEGLGISFHRLLLDLHTGRIVGSWGPYIMDFAALALIFLGISGLMANGRKSNGKRKK